MQFDNNKNSMSIRTAVAVVISLCTVFTQVSYAEDKVSVLELEKRTCYDQKGETTGCPAKERVLPFAVPVFQDNGNQTITDFQTRLSWQQDTADINGDGKISSKDTLNWKKANSYCSNLEMAGHDDWRLPAINELNTLVDFNRKIPAILPFFTSQSSYYWSSTSYIYKKEKAWCVSFYFGNSVWSYKSGKFFLRCVRGGQGL